MTEPESKTCKSLKTKASDFGELIKGLEYQGDDLKSIKEKLELLQAEISDLSSEMNDKKHNLLSSQLDELNAQLDEIKKQKSIVTISPSSHNNGEKLAKSTISLWTYLGIALIVGAIVFALCFWYFNEKLSPIVNFNYMMGGAAAVLVVGIILVIVGATK